jgi:hypothetical protein
MGALSNIVSFGAGYTLGAKMGGAPLRSLRNAIARGAIRHRRACSRARPRSATS